VVAPHRKYFEPGGGAGSAGYRLWNVKPQGYAALQEILRRLESLPGVEKAAAINYLPFAGGSTSWGMDFQIEGEAPGAPWQQRYALRRLITPGYFRALGIPLLQGRPFDDRDTAASPRVVIINEAMARQFWPEGAVGRRLRLREGLGNEYGWYEIVGVSRDARQDPVEKWKFHTYVPYSQPQLAFQQGLSFVVRAAGDPARLASAMRQVAREVDPEVAVEELSTMDQVVGRALGPWRAPLLLLELFAGIGGVLAMVGIYGVVSCAVTRRTREIRIRVALGAQGADVVRLILRRSVLLTAAGLGLGLAGALALTRLLSTQLFGITPTDPATFAVPAAVLASVALLASYLPARRATRVDPVTALRHE